MDRLPPEPESSSRVVHLLAWAAGGVVILLGMWIATSMSGHAIVIRF